MTSPKQRSLRLSSKLDEAVERYTNDTGLTFSHIVREALQDYLSSKDIDKTRNVYRWIPAASKERSVTTHSYIAAEDLEKNTWCALNESNQVVAYSVDAPNPIGVAYHDALAGDTVTVVTSGWER